MKTITIRQPDVAAAMLVEVWKKSKAFKDQQQLMIQLIRKAYQKVFVWQCVKGDFFCLVNLLCARDYLSGFNRG